MLDPQLINGASRQDERGIVSFVNDFSMADVKRFYTICHPDTSIVRAWQGHKLEQKWFHVIEGMFTMVLVRPDNWANPDPKLPCIEFDLKAINNQVLHVPGGYATGFRALIPQSKMIVFSDLTVTESVNDDYRFEKGLWFDWV